MLLLKAGSVKPFLVVVGCVVTILASANLSLHAEERSAKVMRLGFVATVSASVISPGYTVDFWERLRQLGWTRGKNLIVEERWADGHLDRVPMLMNEVVADKVDLILTGTEAGALAAEQATQTIPIIAVAMGDPVRAGIVSSLSHPGGNLTGFSLLSAEGIPSKCVQLLREALPGISALTVLSNPDYPLSRIQVEELEADEPLHGMKLRIVTVRSPQDLERALEQTSAKTQAVLALSDSLAYEHRRRLISLASKHHLPVASTILDYVPDGALIAYGADFRSMYWRAAEYVDKIFRGTKPGDLPIEQSTRLKLAVNLRTAKQLGLRISESILLRADEIVR
jgi:putative tryptophan/tyrosine transport system substrate-binding protein